MIFYENSVNKITNKIPFIIKYEKEKMKIKTIFLMNYNIIYKEK